VFSPLTIDPATSAPPGDMDVGVVTESTSTRDLSIGLLAAGGGLFAARRIAARSRRMR
jgi:hypothetical protein